MRQTALSSRTAYLPRYFMPAIMWVSETDTRGPGCLSKWLGLCSDTNPGETPAALPCLRPAPAPLRSNPSSAGVHTCIVRHERKLRSTTVQAARCTTKSCVKGLEWQNQTYPGSRQPVPGEGGRRRGEKRARSQGVSRGDGGAGQKRKSYHAAEHFVLVVGEEQHHVGPPRASRPPGDLQAAAQQHQQEQQAQSTAAARQVAGAATPGPTWSQRHEPHGGQGSGQTPGRGGGTRRAAKGDRTECRTENGLWREGRGPGSGVFSLGTIT